MCSNMATTLSTFVHHSYHQNFESADFSYSYSDLPVVQSKKVYECPVFVKPKTDILSKNNYVSLPNYPKHCDVSVGQTGKDGLNIKCEKKGGNVSLIEKQQQKCIKDVKKFIFETECTNLSSECGNSKSLLLSKNDVKRSLGSSKSFGKVEGLKKKFEFQSRLSKSVDKNHNDREAFESRFNESQECELVKSQLFSTNSAKLSCNTVVNVDKKISSKTSHPISPVKFATNKVHIKNNSSCNITANSAVNVHKSFSKTINDFENTQIESHKVDIKGKISAKKSSISTIPNVLYSLPEQQIERPVVVKSNSLDEKSNRKRSPDKDSERGSSLATSVLRLRNSIFSSLKLPRKVSSKMSSQQQLPTRENLATRSYVMGGGSLSSSATNNKRKSAVELLAESKAFYVKSETVLDRKQELPLRVNTTLCTGTNSGTHYATLSGRHRRAGSGGEPLQNQLRRLLGPTSLPSPIVPQEVRSQTLKYDRKSKASYDWDGNSHQSSANRSHYNSGTFSANSSSGTSGSKGQVKSDPEHSRASTSGCYSSRSLNRPSSSGDNRIFFPDSFVVPKPSRSDPANVFSNSFSIESPFSSPEKIDAKQILSVVDSYDNYGRPDSKIEYYDDRDLIENYSTISPPAEYAVTERSNYRYIRSNSHSHTMKTNQENTCVMNFNSHKSLPDLHKQAEQYTENGRRLAGVGGSGHYLPGCETAQNYGIHNQAQVAVRSSEALSCYSKATSVRSYRSPALSSKGSDGYSRRSASCHNSDMSGHTGRGSADEAYYYNRSGSSYARDSGGSSGHCSGPLGPPSLRGLQPVSAGSLQQRRDSGSSTQHSSTRSHRYSSYYMDRYQESDQNDASHLEYHVSAPLQFQDGVQFNHTSNGNQLNVNATVSISTNFASRNDGFRTSGMAHIETCQPNDRPALVGIHFQASIPPVQFQDAQTPMYTYNSSYSSEGFYGRRESGTRESRHLLTRRPASSGCNQQSSTSYEEEHEISRLSHETEESPPGLSGLGNFKRQRCLRFKHRPSPRRPILRSKSDISDRYWRGDDKGPLVLVEKSNNTPPSSDNNSPSRAARIKLDKFFDQLGMDDETYKEVILKDLKKPRRKDRNKTKSSPSHVGSRPDIDVDSKCSEDEGNDELSSSFASSDISFPDSNLIPNNADYTVQGAANDKPYRSCEPLSIVERNARIIKWLCNCRKLQAV